MTLADLAIKRAMNRLTNRLVIDPFLPENLQPASVDLTLGNRIIFADSVYIPPYEIDLTKSPWTDDSSSNEPLSSIGPNHGLFVSPGQFLLADTVETVTIPTDMIGRLEGKSSLGRKGLIVHVTAGFFDPGFTGTATLEIYNLSKWPVHIYAGMKICQMSFHQLTEPVERPYGSEGLGSHYQGQSGPTLSRT